MPKGTFILTGYTILTLIIQKKKKKSTSEDPLLRIKSYCILFWWNMQIQPYES